MRATSALPPDPFFAGAGLDRADLLRPHSDKLALLAKSSAARELAWENGLPAVTEDGRLEWRAIAEPTLFLGLAGDAPRFSAVRTPAVDPRAAFSIIGLLDPAEAPTFAAALSLSSWHSRHQFCANCGAPSEVVRGGWSRRCDACAAEHFPRVDPVVIMLAEHGGRLLLGRQPHYPPNRYSALAGFVEVGESIEDAVARELEEEAGIAVSSVRYLCSQPWPFPSSLMIGCMAFAKSDELTIDTTELDDARWFTRAEVEAAMAGDAAAPFLPPPPVAIANTLLAYWLGALEEGGLAP